MVKTVVHTQFLTCEKIKSLNKEKLTNSSSAHGSPVWGMAMVPPAKRFKQCTLVNVIFNKSAKEKFHVENEKHNTSK